MEISIFNHIWRISANTGYLVKPLFCVFLLWLCMGLMPTAYAKSYIGLVKTIQGNPIAFVPSANTFRRLQLNSAVYTGEHIITNAKQSVGITFADGAIMTIGPKSTLELTNFVFNPAEKDVAFVSKIYRGTLSFISGAIGRIAPEKVSIVTPTAVLGLRGTKILVEVR